MARWEDIAGTVDLAEKPFTKALLEKAPADLEFLEKNYGWSAGDHVAMEDLIESAIVADAARLLYPALVEAQNPDTDDSATFPRDRIMAFVCAIWLFGEAIFRIGSEGRTVDMNALTRRLGTFFFMPYGEKNYPGLIAIGVQYWKELGAHLPASIGEWHRAFLQMVYIHYEKLTGTRMDLGDFDVDLYIGKMLTVFLSMNFKLPES